MKYLKVYDEKCIGCNTCVSVCSTLFFKENNAAKSCIRVFPAKTDESGSFTLKVCNQCGSCVDVCPTDALSINKMGVVLLNKKLCTFCYACAAACPTDIMLKHTEGEAPIKCIACGACAKECPAEALEIFQET